MAEQTFHEVKAIRPGYDVMCAAPGCCQSELHRCSHYIGWLSEDGRTFYCHAHLPATAEIEGIDERV